MTLHCKDVWEDGAGRIDYVWHVAGMPWAACNSEKLRVYLEAMRMDGSVAGEAIKHWFGESGSSGRFVRFLSILDERNTKWDWKFDEAAGLSGGDYQVQLAEADPGINWATMYAVNDELPGTYVYDATGILSSAQWGIPGVSQIYDLSNDDGIYYAEIKTTATKDDADIVVKDVRGFGNWLGTLNFSNIDYAVIWIGHEAIGIGSYTDDGDGEYTLTCTRGLFRTRAQAHVAPEYSTIGEYVSTAPLGGIVGRPSYLWAFPSSDDGATYGNPTLMLHGKVSQGIRIRDGVATIRCLGPIDWMKSPSATSDYQGHLAGYLLQRGPIGTEPGTTYGPAAFNGRYPSSMMRAPHIIMYEKYDDGVDVGEHWSSIWLCEKSSYAMFWTIEELINALQTELDKCSAQSGSAWESQLSGDDTTDNPRQSLKHYYVVTKKGIARKDDSSSANYVLDNDTLCSMVGGPVAIIFGFSLPFSFLPFLMLGPPEQLTFLPVTNNLLFRGNIASSLANGDDFYHSWGTYRTFDTGYINQSGPLTAMQYVPPIDMVEQCWKMSAPMSIVEIPNDPSDFLDQVQRNWWPVYYYEFSSDTETDYAENGELFGPDSWAIPYANGYHRLYIEPSTGGLPVPGVSLQLGGENFGPRLACTISASGIDGDVWYATVSSSSLYNEVPGTYGASSADKVAVFTNRTYYPCLAWLQHGQPTDPWAVSQGSMDASSNNAIDLLQGALGFGSLPLSPSQALGWVPDVEDDGDYYSWIDWDNLDYEPITSDETYRFSGGAQSFIDTFMSFLRSHSLVPYLELMQEANYDLWKMRFRILGNVSISEAYGANRRINDNVLLLGKSTERDVGSGHLYSSINIKMNYVLDEPMLELNITDKSAYAQGGYARKSWVVDDRFTVCKSLSAAATSKAVQAAITSRYTTGILRHISRPRAATSADGVCRALARLPVGAAALATDAYGRHPWTGARGYSDMPCTVTGISLDLGSMRARISWTLSHSGAKGWAPAVYCPAGSIHYSGLVEDLYVYLIATGSYDTDVLPHEFSLTNQQSDLSRFDCLDYDEFTATYSARGCSCGNYNIRITETDNSSTTPVFGTISVSLDGSTATFSTTAALSVNGDNNTDLDYIMQFGAYSTSQSCQRALYVGFCDSDGYCGDGTSSDRWQ